jgi:hypothetical protein
MIQFKNEYWAYSLAQLAALTIGMFLSGTLSQVAIALNVAVDGLLFGALAFGLSAELRTSRDACVLRLGRFWLFASGLVTMKYSMGMGSFGVGVLFYFVAYALLLGVVLAIAVGLSFWRGASRA